MSAPPKTTPRPFDHEVASSLGHFMAAFSMVEAVIEIGIARQLNLDPIRASIVSCSLQFKGRAMMLSSLLHLDELKNAEAIKVLKAILNRGERNDIVHAVLGYREGILTFYRRKTDLKYKTYSRPYDAHQLMALAAEFSGYAVRLQALLGISADEYVMFFDAAHGPA